MISDRNAIAWADSDQGPVVIKWSSVTDLFTRLDASARLLGSLAARGVPVATPLATRDGLARTVLNGPTCELSVAVVAEVTGAWLDVTNEEAVVAAGAQLACLHEVLGEVDIDTSAFGAPMPLRERLRLWLDGGDRGLAKDASRRLAGLQAGIGDLDDVPQLVHNDYRAANILMRGTEVVGVLDFDDIVLDYRVSDLAKASVYLGTRFTSWRPTPRVAQLAFRAGYESLRPLTAREADWFEALLLWQAILAIPGSDDPYGWATAL